MFLRVQLMGHKIFTCIFVQPVLQACMYVHVRRVRACTHAHTPTTPPPSPSHPAGRRCDHAVWLRTLAKEILDQPEIFSQNNTMYQSQEFGLTHQEVNMFSVFTQRMTFCLMMLMLHHKHITLPKKHQNKSLSGQQLQMAKER